MKKKLVHVALCVVFSCLTLPVMAGHSDDEKTQGNFLSKKHPASIETGDRKAPRYKIKFALPSDSNTPVSDIADGISAFNGVLKHGLRHFRITLAKSTCPPDVMRAFDALHHVLTGASAQLEVTAENHSCADSKDSGEEAIPSVAPLSQPAGVILPSDTAPEQPVSEAEKDAQTQF